MFSQVLRDRFDLLEPRLETYARDYIRHLIKPKLTAHNGGLRLSIPLRYTAPRRRALMHLEPFYDGNICPNCGAGERISIEGQSDEEAQANLVRMFELATNCITDGNPGVPNGLIYSERHTTRLVEIRDALRRLQANLDVPNNVCTICLNDLCAMPVYCMLCRRVVACATCVLHWFERQEEDVVRCLVCQRRFLRHCAMVQLTNKAILGRDLTFFERWALRLLMFIASWVWSVIGPICLIFIRPSQPRPH